MKYVKQLDSLRAIAVLCVIVSHWLPSNNIVQRITCGSLGEIGVDIFFVLSGFLITRILLESRLKAEELNISKSTLIKNFYIRRSLRIFPIYYLTILLLLWAQKSIGTDIQSSFLYFATYTSNFYFFKIQCWDGFLSHLWSLAVEEQFYLFWPWVILFFNKKYLLYVILCFILIGVLSQYILKGVGMSSVLTFNCFDAFGIGALLSWQTTFNNRISDKFYRGTSIFALVAILFFGLGIIQKKWEYIPIRTIVAVISLWIITYIILNHETGQLKFKLILNNRFFIFIGKISYGMYLYHNIIPSTINSKIVNKYLNPFLPDFIMKNYWGQLFLIENTVLLILLSWGSYILIEKRFLNLKRLFVIEVKPSVQNIEVIQA